MSDAPRTTGGATGAQILAADPTQSVWVSANAGTGKTRVLIDRISRLLLAGTPPGKILCLTFTKAAAAEMANRLSERLGKWAMAADTALHDDLGGLLGRAATEDDLTRARELFAEVLDTPGGLKIRTIHSFCESLLGQFPLEARVAPHFAVVDERTEAELLAEARDAVLRRIATAPDPELTASLEVIAAAAAEAGFDAVIRELVNDRRKFRDAVDRHGSLSGLLEAIRAVLGLEAGATCDSVLAEAGRDGAFDEAGLRSACAALAGGTASDEKRGLAVAAWLDDPAGRAAGLNGEYRKVFLKADGGAKAEQNLMTKKPREADPAAFDALLVEQERMVTLDERLKAARTLETTAALLRLGDLLVGEYQNLKERRGLLDYDDLILKARELLRGDGQAAWVHFKLDGGIDHVLVDEAQDTSPEQWDVIAALTGEFFAGAGAREEERTVFAVGDEKQSIYSFQGADPDAFARMERFFEARAAAADRRWQLVEMPLSFRSVWTVLKAVDKVFADDAAAAGLTFGGRAVRHLSSRTGQAGLIEVWPTLKPADDPDPDPWDAPLDQIPASSPQVQLAQRIAEQVKSWIDGGKILESKGRPIRADDIMILVRRRAQFAEEMIRALKQRGIAVAGSDRMVLTEQVAVMDLLSLARFLLLPEDDLSLAEVLKGPLFGWDDDALLALAFERKEPLWRELRRRARENEAWRDTDARLAAMLDRADFTPPFEFFSHLLGPEGGRRQLVERLGPEANDPIDEFLALALDYEREHVPSLQGFLRWIESGETQIKRDLEHDRPEVRVMTVHGAKGLQANIVFLPDTCATPDVRLGDRLLWTDPEHGGALLWPGSRDNEGTLCRDLREAGRQRQMQEYRRLLYVAMTRACDRLYVCGWENKRGRSEGCWYDLVAAAVKAAGEEVRLPGFEEPGWRVTDRQEAEPDARARSSEAPPPAPVLPDWAHRPAAAEPEPSRPLSPSRPDGEEPAVRSPLGTDSGERFKRGRLIHSLLQTLPDLPPDSRRRAAETYLARDVHGLEEGARREIAAETLRLLEDSRLTALFGPDSRAEVPLVGEVGGFAISAQIDRLLVTDEAVTVIDYKTNRPPPQNEQGVPPIYLKQMAAYREALRRIYPDRPVRCLLLWTDGPQTMDLSDSLLDRHAP